MVNPIIMDTSVMASWFFDDEVSAYAQTARALVEEQEKIIAVPSLWYWEISNVLLIAERRKRTDSRKTKSYLQALSALPIEIYPPASLTDMQELLDLARKEHLTSYDAAYLELAQRTAFPLATLDKKLKKAAQHQQITVFEKE